MIKVVGRELLIPHSERELGFEHDNMVEVREFLVTDKSLFDLSFKLDVSEPCAFIDLEKSISDDNEKMLLTWNISSGITQKSGRLNIQLRAIDTQGTLVWHSEIETFFVRTSIDATNQVENVALLEFKKIEIRTTLAKEEAQQQALIAKGYAEESEETAEEIENLLQDQSVLLEEKADKDHIHDAAGENTNGFMSASDKGKLDGIDEGANKTEIVQTTGDSETAVMSQKAVTDEINKHVSDKENPHNLTATQLGVYTKEEVDASLSGKVSKADVVQTTGNSETKVMSQKAVTEELNGKADKEHSHSLAGENTNGFMSASDKGKLDGIDEGANKTEITQTTGDSQTAVMSQKAVTDEINKHVSDKENPHNLTATQLGVYTKEEVDASLSGKVSKADVVQTTGNSETKVMSQKAVTEVIDKASSLILTTKTAKAQTITDSGNYDIVGASIYGESTQEGEPTEETPIDIVSVENPNVSLSGEEVELQTVTFNGVALRSVGDIKDEIVVENGTVKHFQNVMEINVDNTNFIVNAWSSYGYTVSHRTALLRPPVEATFAISTHFKGNKNGPSLAVGCVSTASTVIYLKPTDMSEPHCSSADSFKQWLIDNNVKIVYKLNLPIETDITNTEAGQAILALHTNYPNTTISCNADCKITYKADTTNAYKNLKSELDTLKQAIISVGGTINV